MLTLAATNTLVGLAGTGSAVTATALGVDAAIANGYKVLGTAVLGTGATTIATAGASPYLVKILSLVNTTGSDVTGVKIFVNGSAAANQIAGSMTIPANGWATYADGEWKVYNSTGAIVLTTGVTSFNSRTGAVVPAQADYDSFFLTPTEGDAAYVPLARTVSTTAPLTGGGALSANRTLAIDAATTSAAGSLSALDKKKLDNLWYDVTCWSATPANNLVGDDSTDNVSAWNALFAAVPVGATIYFPTGTYRFASAIAITADKHLNICGSGKYSAIIKTTSVTADGFTISGGQYWYNTFSDLRFEYSGNVVTTPKTAGAAILISTVGLASSAQQVGINIYRCSFNNWFKAIYCVADNVGQGPGNLSVWDSLDISITGGNAANGTGSVTNARGIHINGAGTNLTCSNSTINMGFPPFHVNGTAAIEINASGAIQFTNGEFIGGINTMLLNASSGGTTSVAAVYATNCFLDQSAGSTLKVTGANVVNRVKFVQCGITGGNVASATAVEIASSGTGAAGTATAAADGIDFFDCDIYPNGGSGTINGFLITGAQGVNISACRISGWTNGVQVTPAAANGYTKLVLSGNKMGATNNFTTPNTVGLLLNAGSFQYGTIYIDDTNDFTGSTTPITDNSTIGPTSTKYLPSGSGVASKALAPLASGGATLLAANGRGAVTSGAAETFLATFRIPANGVQIGDIIQITMLTQSSSTGALTARVRCGTGGTIADALVNVSGASAAASGAGAWVNVTFYIYVVALGATGTVYATLSGTSLAAAFNAASVAETLGNVVTTAAWFITVSGTTGTGTYTVRSIKTKFI